MSVYSRPGPAPQPEDEGVIDGNIVAVTPQPRPGDVDPLVAAFAGTAAQPRVAAVRRSLDQALDGWWRNGALPAPALLRDSLLLLEAGNELDEAQRSLLLRGALVYRRGMLTALRYQTDPERTAVILAEAVLEGNPPLRPDELAQLARSDEQGTAWQPALVLALQQDAAHPDPVRRERVAAALAALAGPAPAVDGADPAVQSEPEVVVEEVAPGRGQVWLRVALILLMVGVIGGVFLWQQNAARDMVQVPAGAYVLRTADGTQRTVDLPAFAIDNFETTNAVYRRCVEQNACAWPTTVASATRPHYFLDPSFATYPVINVDWANAARFCTFVGKRLPTVDEWEVAASYAPATHRAYVYPWGDQFVMQAANNRGLGIGDTTAVGAYSPTGDSPLGLSDMAGNVAEWTQSAATDGEAYIVKGGAYRDDAAALRASASVLQPAGEAAPWLGFRCAASAPPP